jgi:hypothetical protein
MIPSREQTSIASARQRSDVVGATVNVATASADAGIAAAERRL